ncbi:GNAT family N-acetyltransferase [Devosia riboflavina]
MGFYPDLPITTQRLTLRPFTRGDVDAVLDYRGREDVALYLFDTALSREECALAVQQRTLQTSWSVEGDKIVLAAVLSESDTVIGELSLIWRSEDARQGEIGWIFHPDHHGQGFATEAASALFDLGFQKADLHRIFARCDTRNGSSWRLMERLGMRREAHFREHARFKGGWDEEFVYAVLRREWRNGG